jgi:hypothetical protein
VSELELSGIESYDLARTDPDVTGFGFERRRSTLYIEHLLLIEVAVICIAETLGWSQLKVVEYDRIRIEFPRERVENIGGATRWRCVDVFDSYSVHRES